MKHNTQNVRKACINVQVYIFVQTNEAIQPANRYTGRMAGNFRELLSLDAMARHSQTILRSQAIPPKDPRNGVRLMKRNRFLLQPIDWTHLSLLPLHHTTKTASLRRSQLQTSRVLRYLSVSRPYCIKYRIVVILLLQILVTQSPRIIFFMKQ